jgi:hypothetical protein
MAWSEGAEQGLAHAREAVRSASRTGDPEIECRALAAYGDWNFRAGRGMQQAEMDRAMTLERSLPSWPLDRGPTDLFSRQLVLVADLEAARELLHELYDAHATRDNADGASTATWWLSLLEWRAGNWEAAERHAADSFDVRTQLGQVMPGDGFPVALIAAHRGRVDEARTAAERDLADAEAMDIRISVSGSAWILGFLELSLGDPSAALSQLERSYELRSDFMLEPGQRLGSATFSRPSSALGPTGPKDVLATWQERAERLDRASTLAILARSRGLLHAARGSHGRIRELRDCAPSTPERRIRSSRPVRCLLLGRQSGEQNGVPTHARRWRQRWPSSSVSARPSGRTRPAPSSAGSGAARPRAAT